MNAEPKPPRVLMVVPQYPFPVVGGLERQAHELAKALAELGIEVQATSGSTQPGQSRHEIVEGIPVWRLVWPRAKSLRFLRTSVEMSLVLWFRRDKYDVIHLHQHSWFGLYTILLAAVLAKPILTKLPNVGAHGIVNLLSRPLGRLKLFILSRSDAIVSMSEQSLSELMTVGFPRSRILAVPNGIRIESTRDENDPSKSGSRVICRVVCVGRLTKQKRIDTLLGAWRTIVSEVQTPVALELWGDGPLEADLRRLSRQHGIEESVSFCGHVDAVRRRLSAMDIFVLPSENEGNSNAILEAMASGLPVVSTWVGGTPMQVGLEGAPFLIEPGDESGLATKLAQLIDNPALRAKLGAAMRRRVEMHFDISKVAQTYAKAYKLLVSGQRQNMYQLSDPVIQRDYP